MSCPSIAYGGDPDVSRQPPSIATGLLQSSTAFPSGEVIYLGLSGHPVRQTYSKMLQRARRILGGLQSIGLGPGDRLILYFNKCENFVPALWAALLGGIIPVPVGRHEWKQHHESLVRENLAHVSHLLNCQILTDGGAADNPEPYVASEKKILLDVIEDENVGCIYHDADPDAPALFVLTSGATGRRRIVMLSARAVINRWWPTIPLAQEASAFLAWLPFDHIMGMAIAGPNLPTKIYLPTSQFVGLPAFWLDAVMQFGVTHSTMTNFGISLIERYVASVSGRVWDLSSIRKIGIGAEAISPELCRRFFKALQPFGLSPDALILGYGLTECGPVVGGSRSFSIGATCKDDQFPALDRPTCGHSVRIVDADGSIVPEGVIGEVQVKGPTMALGYFEQDGTADGLFAADGWLKTGDLGLLEESCLTITGREKEIIIIHAQKYGCLEIEGVAQSVAGVEAAYAVAAQGTVSNLASASPATQFALFFVATPTAALSLRKIGKRLRAVIGATYGVAPSALIPVREAEIPRTPSGKVQRLLLASRLEAGEYRSNVASHESLNPECGELVPPSNAQEEIIFSLWVKILGTNKFGIHHDFFDTGGDSLSAMRMAFELECALKKPFPIVLLFEYSTVAELAAFVGEEL